MNTNRQVLVSLLSATIHRKESFENTQESVDWVEILNDASVQGIAPIIYPTVLSLQNDLNISDEIINKWKEIALFSGLMQASLNINIREVLAKFHSEGIPIIVLKGLYLRTLYPQPDLRPMSDVDILVREADIERAKSLLKSIGYFYNDDHDSKEVHFYHPSEMLIELHWRLTVPGYIEKSDLFESRIWDNSEEIDLQDVPVRILSINDFIIHLCLHMIFHIYNSGFGLKMLCDLVLLVEARGEEIDWNLFSERIIELSIDRFVQMIFIVCNRLLEFELPPINYSIDQNDLFVDIFINDIFRADSGKDERKNVNQLIKSTNGKNNFIRNKLILFKKIIFPPFRGLAKVYSYLYKYPFLYPIAWIQHMIKHLQRGKMLDNVNNRFKYTKTTHDTYMERSELLEWLGIK